MTYLVIVLVKNLGGGQVEIFLGDMNPPLTQGVHARFRANTLQLCPRATIHLLRDLRQVDATGQVHRPRMNPKNIRTSLHPGD